MKQLGALLLALAGAVAALPAAAQQLRDELRHMWLQMFIHTNHKECCPHDNCFPAPGRPAMTRYGWKVPGVNGTIPNGAEKNWRFPEIYVCWYKNDAGKTMRCLFKPPEEAS